MVRYPCQAKIPDSEQNGGLHTVVLDRVRGTGVIDIFPALAAGDGFPAVHTFQKNANN